MFSKILKIFQNPLVKTVAVAAAGGALNVIVDGNLSGKAIAGGAAAGALGLFVRKPGDQPAR